jgi:hypothetical protein
LIIYNLEDNLIFKQFFYDNIFTFQFSKMLKKYSHLFNFLRILLVVKKQKNNVKITKVCECIYSFLFFLLFVCERGHIFTNTNPALTDFHMSKNRLDFIGCM